MAKKQRKFHVAVTIPENYRENGRLRTRPGLELLIYGFSSETETDKNLKEYDYDIDEVWYKDHSLGEFRRLPLNIIEALAGVESIKELEHFHEPCMIQAAAVFSVDANNNVDHLQTAAA